MIEELEKKIDEGFNMKLNQKSKKNEGEKNVKKNKEEKKVKKNKEKKKAKKSKRDKKEKKSNKSRKDKKEKSKRKSKETTDDAEEEYASDHFSSLEKMKYKQHWILEEKDKPPVS